MSKTTVTFDNADDAVPLLMKDGYAVIRGFLGADQVADARRVCDGYLLPNAEAEAEIEATTLLRIQELNFIFDQRLVEALTRWLGGSLTLYPNYLVRLNRRTEWHVDNGFSPRFLPNADHLYDPAFRHVQCVVYLQDNLPGAGGGLDVRPGSHRWAADGARPDDDYLFSTYPGTVSIDSKAGDLIVFDGRLMHRGTPQNGSQTLRKYGLFWSASRTDQTQIDRYLAYFHTRLDHLRTLDLPAAELRRDVLRHNLMHSVRFPNSYLPEAVKTLRQHGVHLAEMPTQRGG